MMVITFHFDVVFLVFLSASFLAWVLSFLLLSYQSMLDLLALRVYNNYVLSLGSSLIIFSLFYFFVSWSKMTDWGTSISFCSATWIIPQISRG